MSVVVARGDEALRRLDDGRFVEEWARLHASCAWATTFQSYPFVDGWYRLHAQVYEPLIVEGRDRQQRLVGLLTLARRRSGRLLVGAGDFHAEYQSWIADEAVVQSFLWESLRLLERSYPRGRMRLAYLPPTTPLGWTHADSVWPRRIHLRPRAGGFIDLSDPARIDASLQKGHNRNRLNGLRRSGAVVLESIDTVDGLLREIDEIAVLCDLRQGAVNDSLPFTNNPLKRPLHIEMMRRGLLRVTVLRVGEAIASAHLDVKNGDDVLLYLAAHAPRFARHSPGSLHILLLARQLASEGVRRFDLSPGGGYKDRFADHSETAFTLTARFGFANRLISDLSGRTEAGATSVLSVAGQTPRSALAKVRDLRANATRRVAVRRSGSARRMKRVVLQLPDLTSSHGAESLAVDHLPDLLAYRREAPQHPSTRDFLRLALHRLESGHHVLTRMDGPTLAECWWLCRLERHSGDGGIARRTDVATAPALLLYDPVLLPSAGRHESHPDVPVRLRSTLRAIAPDATPLLALSVEDKALLDTFVRAGATLMSDASGPMPSFEDVSKKLASGWPVERPGTAG